MRYHTPLRMQIMQILFTEHKIYCDYNYIIKMDQIRTNNNY